MSMILLSGTLALIFLGVGLLYAGVGGVLSAIVLLTIIIVSGTLYSQKIVLKLYNAHPFQSEKLQEMLEYLAHEAKIPAPKLCLIPSAVMNTFSVGCSTGRSCIVLTQGILTLEEEEIQAVLAHELVHIRNRDTVSHSFVAVLAGAFSFVAQLGYVNLSYENGGKRIPALLLVAIFSPIAAFLVRLTVDKQREYRADYCGSLLTKNPEAMASALRKISKMSARLPIQGISATSHLWIVTPFSPNWFNSLFITHPPVEQRIERLEVIRSFE